MNGQLVTIERQGHILLLGLNRPGKRNAFNRAMHHQLSLGFAGFVFQEVGAGTESGLFAACQGGPGYNSWYGNGQVNAFNAVTHTSSNQ